jgi:hypothetical protein
MRMMRRPRDPPDFGVVDQSDEPARFKPLHHATRDRLRLLYSVGPLLWVVGLAIVSEVVRRGNSVKIALIVLGASLLVSLAFLVPMRARRVRMERRKR